MMVRLVCGAQNAVGAQQAWKTATAIDRDEKLSHPYTGARNTMGGARARLQRMREGMWQSQSS